MNIRSDKAQKLEQVSRLYYEQGKTQGEIAKQLGVSRPLISRMLQEARDAGIVEIRIHTPIAGENLLLNHVKSVFGITGGVAVPESSSDTSLNQALASTILEYLRKLGGTRLGIGWGHLIGVLVSNLEKQAPSSDVFKRICPMVGNSGISIRNYHSNENVRILASHMIATPYYLHTPAFAENQLELELIQQTEHYRTIYKEWEQLDVALVNIGNYPSTPDFASSARYGSLLAKQQAVGRLIAYYFNEQGEIIHSDHDYAIQIPLSLLKKCKHVVGVCSANVSKHALIGALRTGMITDIIARERLLKDILEIR